MLEIVEREQPLRVIHFGGRLSPCSPPPRQPIFSLVGAFQGGKTTRIGVKSVFAEFRVQAGSSYVRRYEPL